jgi:hypothetical protein
MTTRQARSKPSSFASLASRLPTDVAAVVRREAMDLSDVSLFCRRQADCAASWGSILQIKPGLFVLKSPFKESFIESLHCYVYPNMGFRPEETVAHALLRHATWYLKIRDIDALRKRASTCRIQPRALAAPMTCKEGIIKPTGEFTRDPEADGAPAMLAWQDIPGDQPSLAIEVCGPGIIPREPAFRRALLHSIVDFLSVEWGLKRPSVGRPPLATQAESAAYLRDHRCSGRSTIAKELCSCGKPHHTQKCFDRLSKLADNFYRAQKSSFEELVRDHARKYPEIKQEHAEAGDVIFEC